MRASIPRVPSWSTRFHVKRIFGGKLLKNPCSARNIGGSITLIFIAGKFSLEDEIEQLLSLSNFKVFPDKIRITKEAIGPVSS